MTFYFDMDGTLFDFYNVENWLEDLRAFNTRPYLAAKALINFSQFARIVKKLQAAGYKVKIISWTSKVSDDEFHRQVAWAKLKALKRHLPSIKWDDIVIAKYGESKSDFADDTFNILFDDDEKVRNEWRNKNVGFLAIDPNNININDYLKSFLVDLAV